MAYQPPPIDQGTKQAVANQDEETTECIGDTSLDNKRKDMENTDEPTEDDATATSEKSEESVTTLDSKPKAQAQQYLMMDFAQRIELSESPANYVIYLYNKAFIFFSARVQVPMSHDMEEGVHQFYKQSGCPTLKWFIARAPKVTWRKAFSASILNFFESFFPFTPYRGLQLEAMVRIPITIALYAMKYITGRVWYPFCEVSMLFNVEDFRVLWEIKAEDL
jgi:hypothetical protein